MTVVHRDRENGTEVHVEPLGRGRHTMTLVPRRARAVDVVVEDDVLVDLAVALLRASGGDSDEIDVAVALLTGNATVDEVRNDVVRNATVTWPLVVHTADGPCARGVVHDGVCQAAAS